MTLHPSGLSAEILVFNRSGEGASCELSEDNMSILKNGCHELLTWSMFFDLLQKAFVDHNIDYNPPILKITIKHERQTEAIPIPFFSTSCNIPFPKCNSGKGEAIYDVVSNMISYVSLRTCGKREIERLESICKLEKDIRGEVIQLRQEIHMLEQETSILKSLRSHATSIEEETQTLAGRDSSLVKLASEALLVPARIDKVISRVTDPLADAPTRSKRYNHDVLQLLKSYALGVKDGNATTREKPFDVISSITKERQDALQREFANDPACALLIRMYHLMEEWDFDIFKFDEVCRASLPQVFGAGALFYLGYLTICKLGLMTYFNLSEKCLISWLSMVEEGYQNKLPYHNSLHAADVLQATLFMLTNCDGIRKLGMSESHQLALILACICHDFNHPGTDNSFQIRTRSDLACVFADESPLEQMHYVSVMELMKLQRYNLFRMVDPTIREGIEETMCNLILATDLDRHDSIVAAFRLRLQEISASYPINCGENMCQGDDALLVMCMIIKSANISSCARREDLYMQWAVRLQQEYQNQGALEVQADLTPSPFMGNNITFHTFMAKLQIAFINYAVVPTFTLLCEILPRLRITGEFVAINRNKWANAEENEALGKVL